MTLRRMLTAAVVLGLIVAGCSSSHRTAGGAATNAARPRGPPRRTRHLVRQVGAVDGRRAHRDCQRRSRSHRVRVRQRQDLVVVPRPGRGRPPAVDRRQRQPVRRNAHEGERVGHVRRRRGSSSRVLGPRTRSTSLFRADATVAGKPLVGGWVLGSNGEHRGAINIGPNPNPIPAPNLNGLASPQLVTVDTGVRNTQVSASAVLPANTSISVPNTTGFGQFVLVGMGDSYSAGEGNPFKSANLPVNETVTAWDKLAAGAVLASPLLGLLTVGTPVLGLAAAIASPAAAHAGGENLMPEVTGFGERSKEQWGGSADHPDAPANEGYRRLCHQGKSPSEKVFERLNADPKYRNVVQFVYYNFASAGSRRARVQHELRGRPRQGHDDHRGADPAAAAAAAGRVGRRVVHHGIGAHVPHDPTCSVVERPALR